ncbi:MAG TPA: ABC transporter permease [Fervidobacterium sp.]|nr:ABC transporter permease [Fervidobacterium sp.]
MLFIKRYLLPRIVQFLVVIFVGITIVFFIPRLSSSNPVEQVIYQITAQGTFLDPAAIDLIRQSLTEMYGLEGGIFQQYFAFWGRLIKGDFGPSLLNFPVPVMDLIIASLPWTVGLLIITTVIAWIVGNILGALAGYFKNKAWVKTLENIVMIIRPMPYYIFALLLLILFTYLLPIFPSVGGYSVGRQIGFNWVFISDLLMHSFLPAMSLIILGIASNFMTMRLIVSNIVAEDYVIYAKAGGLKERKIAFKYVFRNGLLPQITGLALSLGQIFGGALVTEIVFSYPGIGMLLKGAISSRDYNLIIGIVSLSVIGIAGATLIIDLIYPLFDPRIRYR